MDNRETGFFRIRTDSAQPEEYLIESAGSADNDGAPAIEPATVKALGVQASGPTHPVPLPYRILVVEDEVLAGLSLASTLEMAGFEVIGPACSLAEALELLETHGCSLAILDVNLGREETSEPVAQRLKERGIPFFVASGYDAQDRPQAFRGVPSFAKPVGVRAILSAVQAINMR